MRVRHAPRHQGFAHLAAAGAAAVALALLAAACQGRSTGAGTAPVIRAFAADPPRVGAGQTAALTWTVEGATRISIDGLGAVDGGRLEVVPVQDGTYTLRAAGPGGEATAAVSVTVDDPTPAQALFPWAVPLAAAVGGAADLTSLGPAPAGRDGLVRVVDGHLATDAGRVRFFGTNLAGPSNFPSEADAEALAVHLAAMGVNLVRLHHMDSSAEPEGIWTSLTPDRTLSATQLGRLDALVARLKAHGIYVDLNLLVGRPFHPGADLPPDLAEVADWKVRHALGFFDSRLRSLQKAYARDLLTHVNPFTGHAYAEEPAVALVEVANEVGLLQVFKAGWIDSLPSTYQAELAAAWNGWLRARYPGQAALAAAWSAAVVDPPGPELLADGDFAAGLAPWVLEQHGTAMASAAVVTDDPPPGAAQAVRIDIEVPGTLGWHVQLSQAGIAVDPALPYTLSFWARSDRAQEVEVSVTMAHDPWALLGGLQTVALTPAWRQVTATFAVSTADADARVDFGGMGLLQGEVRLGGVSLRAGGRLGLLEGEELAAGTMRPFRSTGDDLRTTPAWRDWMAFLRDTEAAAWAELRAYLRDDLGVRQPLVGTALGYSTPNLMAAFDVVDAHAYWHHPVFPGTDWDGLDWYLVNAPMVNHPDEAATPGLALGRVLGKPQAVTEYDHPAPNTFQAEGIWHLATTAALQDLDVALQYDFAGWPGWSRERIEGWFDSARNPVQAVSMAAAAVAFRRGDLAPAVGRVVAPLGAAREIEVLADRSHWWLPDATDAGVARLEPLVHGVAVATEGVAVPAGAIAPGTSPVAGPVWAADTGELRWDLAEPAHGLLVADAPRTKLLAGFAGGRRVDLTGLSITVGPTLQRGFAAISVTALDALPVAGSARLLLTALGAETNTGAAWALYPGTQVDFPPPAEGRITFAGDAWGAGPVLVEGITAEVELPLAPGAVKVFALDPAGARQGEVPVLGEGGRARFTLTPLHRTLWYEVVVARPGP